MSTDLAQGGAPSEGEIPEVRADSEGFHSALERLGLDSALRSLNETTPHRYTGVFLFNSPALRNVALMDAWDSAAPLLTETNIEDTFCGLVRSVGASFATADGGQDPRLVRHILSESVFKSYCGALIFDLEGDPIGTICHFDTQPCDIGIQAVEVLEDAAKALGTSAVTWR